jgi:hypothetical protein
VNFVCLIGSIFEPVVSAVNIAGDTFDGVVVDALVCDPKQSVLVEEPLCSLEIVFGRDVVGVSHYSWQTHVRRKLTEI